MKKIIILFLLFSNLAFSQQKTDAKKLRQQLISEKSDSTRINIYRNLFGYYSQTKSDSAIYFAKKTIALGNQKGNVKWQMYGYSALGHQQYTIGNYPFGLQMLFKSLKIAESIKDSGRIAIINNSIGNTYKEYEDYDKAIKHYLVCKKIAERINDTHYMIYSNMNLGYVYSQMNQLDKAMQYNQAAYQLELKHKVGIMGIIYSNFGTIQTKLSNKNLAEEYYKMSIDCALKDSHVSRQLAMVFLNFAKFHLIYKETDQALSDAQKSLRMSKLVPYPRGILKASRFLSSLYESEHKIDSAFYYQKLFTTLNDSINSKQRASSIENLTYVEQLRQQEKQTVLEKEAEQRKQNIQYAFIALGIISFLILFLLLSRSIVVNEKWISFFGILGLLIVFEFINLLIHPFLEEVTHHSPILMLLCLVALASLLIPLHHKLEKWIKEKMTEKNKAIRLASAKKTIEQLEK